MQLGARGAQRERQATQKLRGYSKQWAPGDTIRCFLPLIWLEDGRPDLSVGKVWGYPVNDMTGLGLKTTFIPALCDFDADGNPIGTPDAAFQFAKIAPIFVNGQYEKEMAEMLAKPWPSEKMKNEQIDTLKKKFNKDNLKGVKPVIGRHKYLILVEPITAKYIENQGIVRDSVAISNWALSNERLTKIFTQMDDPKYAPAKGDKYIELEFKYPADPDKGNSAKTMSISGLTPEYRLVNKYPSDFIVIESYFNSWSQDAETIRKRATTSVSEDVIKDALRNYCMVHSQYLDAVSDEDDIKILTNNIEAVAQSVSTKFLTNEKLKSTLEEAISKMAAVTESAGLDASIPTEAATPILSTDTDTPIQDVPDLTQMEQLSDAPRLSSLMGNDVLNIGADPNAEDILGDVDFANLV